MHIIRGKCTKKQEISKRFWQKLHIGAGFVHFQNIFMDKNIEKRAWRRWGLKCLALSRHPPLNHKFARNGIYPFTKRLQLLNRKDFLTLLFHVIFNWPIAEIPYRFLLEMHYHSSWTCLFPRPILLLKRHLEQENCPTF